MLSKWRKDARDGRLRGRTPKAPLAGPAREIATLQHAHLVMIAGIVVAAAGVHGVVGGAGGHPSSSTAWQLGAGVAIYLLGEVTFRWLLHMGPVMVRLVAAALILASVALGQLVGGLAQLALVVALLVIALVVEGHA